MEARVKEKYYNYFKNNKKVEKEVNNKFYNEDLVKMEENYYRYWRINKIMVDDINDELIIREYYIKSIKSILNKRIVKYVKVEKYFKNGKMIKVKIKK